MTARVATVSLCVLCTLCVLRTGGAAAQDEPARTGPTRFAIYQAEDRRAQAANDLATLRWGTRAGDPQTARLAVRALGRLERPALVPDILPLLKHALPEVRAEAANALGQALQGLKRTAEARVPAVRSTAARAEAGSPVEAVISSLIARLNVEADGSVRGAIAETLGRAAVTPEQAERVDDALVTVLGREQSIDGRLGIAAGFEALLRLHRRDHPPSDEAVEGLRALLGRMPPAGKLPPDPSRTVRVRRLALEALVTANAVDAPTLELGMSDPDWQVRRIALRGVTAETSGGSSLTEGLTDPVPMVRLDALRAMRARGIYALCRAAVIATGDSDLHVVLFALDQLEGCGSSTDAVAELERAIGDVSAADGSRAWHRAAHAVVSLAGAAPMRAAGPLARLAAASTWQLRMYAARAAGTLKHRATLETLARDDDDNVREAAIDGLSQAVGHDADPVYLASLTRTGNQVLRAAATALVDTPNPGTAAPALSATLRRLRSEGRDNSHDARAAIEKALASVGEPAPPAPRHPQQSDLNADDLREFAAARARVTMRGLGTFELVLFTSEAPATVLRFVRLAQTGYYNGLTFHRVVPNFVIQGGSPGANEYVGDAAFMRDEVGRWPHVRGAVGISTRGRDTGDAQIFIDLVDNPRLDHDYTVFAQVLNGIEIVDQVLEGDAIERIEILTGS
jgi:cyclophilin family peptidyl-prolyl cis-trans isomerase/HEAT repeat protein